MAAVPDWTGFYFGVKAGTQFNSTTYDFASTTPGVYDSHTRIGDFAKHGAYGLYGGFNYQLPIPVVIGVEGDITVLQGKYQLNGPSIDFLQKVNRVDTIAGRVGVLITPRTMVYGKYGASRIKVSGFDDVLPATTFQATLSGTTYGIGIESLIFDNLALRVAADRTKATEDLVLTNNADRYRPEILQVTAGAAVKFNPMPSNSAPKVSWLPTPPAITRSWTSVYVGADIGKAGGSVSAGGPAGGLAFGETGPFTDTASIHSFVVGGDLQLPPFLQVGPTFVVGVQYSKSWTSLKFEDPVGNNNIHQFADISRISALTGRFGFLITPSTLIYGRGGPAKITITAASDYFAVVNPNSGAGTSELKATQAGGGIETFITDHLALRVEGLITQAKENVTLNGVAPADTQLLQPRVTTGTVGLLAKF